MDNYIIVLFKNKKKKRIIKGYSTETNARNKFKVLTKENKVLFPMEYENAEYCVHELAILTTVKDYQIPLFVTDEIGRSEKVFLEGETPYTFLDIKPYHIEEKIYDWQTDSKITLEELIIPSFTPDKVISGNNGIIYLLSIASKAVYRWSAGCLTVRRSTGGAG